MIFKASDILRTTRCVILIAMGALLSAAVAGSIVFFAAYLSCRTIAQITGRIEYMYYMWFLIALEPLVVVGGFAFGAGTVWRLMDMESSRKGRVKEDVCKENLDIIKRDSAAFRKR